MGRGRWWWRRGAGVAVASTVFGGLLVLGAPAATASTLTGVWSGSVTWRYHTSDTEAGGGASYTETATFVLDGTGDGTGMQQASAVASSQFSAGANGPCEEGWSIQRTGSFSGAGQIQVVVRDVSASASDVSLSMSTDPYPLIEIGSGCYQASQDPQDQVTANMPGSTVGGVDPISVSGSWANPANGTFSNAGAQGEFAEYFTWRLTRAPDTDHDGVPNTVDQCPGTPSGVVVDDVGCSSGDTDGDGTPDASDRCPSTPGPADHAGCTDSDGDGTFDDTDRCPDQPGPSATQGCPDDQDHDGFPDTSDACPTTPGVASAGGCPDEDGDTVQDANDACPHTPPGTAVDANGCEDTFRCTSAGAVRVVTEADFHQVVPVPVFADPELFDFSVTVPWCHDDVHAAFGLGPPSMLGDVPPGIASAGFAAAGVDLTYDPTGEHVTITGDRAVLEGGAFNASFGTDALLNLTGVMGFGEKLVAEKLAPKITKLFTKYGDGPQFTARVLDAADEVRGKILAKVDTIDVALRKLHVPNSIAEWVEDVAEDKIGALLDEWYGIVESGLSNRAFSGKVADEIASSLVGALEDVLTFTITVSQWAPTIVVDVTGATGDALVSDVGEHNPIFPVSMVSEGTHLAA